MGTYLFKINYFVWANNCFKSDVGLVFIVDFEQLFTYWEEALSDNHIGHMLAIKTANKWSKHVQSWQ